jgi:hypothetical protein
MRAGSPTSLKPNSVKPVLVKPISVKPTSVKPTSVKTVLRYRNPAIVERFRQEFPISRTEAEQIWRETLKWLWFCGTSTEGGGSASLLSSMRIVDEMWHTFLLFTPEYTKFCKRYFGHYLHHLPTTHADDVRFRARLKRDPARVTRQVLQQRRSQYERIAKELGPSTLRRWYIDYAAKYSPEILRTLRVRALKQAS